MKKIIKRIHLLFIVMVVSPHTHAQPNADFTFFLSDSILCSSETVGFVNLSTDTIPIGACLLDFGDGQSSFSCADTVYHAYYDTGYFNVTLTIVDSLGSTDSETKVDYIYVNPVPQVPSGVVYLDSCEITIVLDWYYDSTYTYIWYFGDGDSMVTSGDSIFTHEYSASGWYELNVTVINPLSPCINSGTAANYYITCPPNGINQEYISDNVNVHIYPNPFTASATISPSPTLPKGKGVFILYDIFGREVKSISLPLGEGQRVGLERGNLPAGMYFYKVTGDRGQGTREIIATGKIIIQK